MKIIALVAAALLGQEAEYAAFVERTNGAVPAPTVETISPVALESLQALRRREGGCVPTGLAMEEPRTAIATFAITQGVASGQIKNGWTVYGRTQGCPDGPPVRFMVLRMPDDQLRAVVVNEGETLANPSLMRDSSTPAAVTAYQTVRTADASCDVSTMRMGATRVAERGSDLGDEYHGAFYSGSWSEIWTFLVCGRSVEVPITFTADGNGGAHYNIRSTEVRIVQ